MLITGRNAGSTLTESSWSEQALGLQNHQNQHANSPEVFLLVWLLLTTSSAAVTWCQSHPCPAARSSLGTTAGEALLRPIFCCICSHTSGFGSPGGFGFLILLWTQRLGRSQGAFSRLGVVASVCSRVPFLSRSSVHEGEPPLIPSSWLLSSRLVRSSSAIRNECFRDKMIFWLLVSLSGLPAGAGGAQAQLLARCTVSRITGLPFGKNSCFFSLEKMLPPPRHPDTQPWHPPRAVSTSNCGRRQQRGCCPHWGLQDGMGHLRALPSCSDPGASLTLPHVPVPTSSL